jgi:hypothetical protein
VLVVVEVEFMTRAQEEPEEVVAVEMLAHLAVEMVPLAQQTQAAVVVVVLCQRLQRTTPAVQAALVSLSSKSHLRTMPHSHLV